MSFFNKFRAILHGIHSFPQPRAQHGAAISNLRAEDNPKSVHAAGIKATGSMHAFQYSSR